MNSQDHSLDHYDQYEDNFDPMRFDRQARRKRKPKARHTPKKQEETILEEIADTTGTLEGGFETTYQPSKYEAGWLLESLRPFYELALITDVVAQVKGGKEASVYRCKAHESVGIPFVAAKVYRPRMFRQLRNDAMYREGRNLIDEDGHEVTDRNKREMRAMQLKSSFGQQLSHTSWLMHEYTTLQALYAAGARVPQPYASAPNALLMAYIGDENMPAPTLNQVNITAEEAPNLLENVLHNVELLLKHGLIHGDLSAYNMLYWEGELTLIDFPQVTSIEANPNAESIFVRDVVRVCDYFQKFDVDCDAEAISADLWARYGVEGSIPDEALT